MSVDSFVFLRSDRLPTVAELQRAMDEAATGIRLEDVGDPRVHTGYWPMLHKGQQSGFEWHIRDASDLSELSLPGNLGDRDSVIHFITHSDLREYMCAVLTGAIIAHHSDGLFYDEESDALIDGESAMEIAKQVESML